MRAVATALLLAGGLGLVLAGWQLMGNQAQPPVSFEFTFDFDQQEMEAGQRKDARLTLTNQSRYRVTLHTLYDC